MGFKEIAENSNASQGALEMEWLLKKVAEVKPKVILEIGVHLGHSLKAWNDAFKPELMIGIDTDMNDVLKIYLMDELRKTVFMQQDSHDVDTYIKLIQMLNGKRVDFLFIDGDHTFEGVKKDYELYHKLVRKGGIIAFHDAAIKDHPLVDVHKFLKGLKHVEVYQADANGVGVIYV